jgi:hypothetical protein
MAGRSVINAASSISSVKIIIVRIELDVENLAVPLPDYFPDKVTPQSPLAASRK